MEIFKSIVTNVLTALYQPFWFAVLLTIFILFFYMYAYHPIDTGKGIKSACLAWIRTFKCILRLDSAAFSEIQST